MQSSVPQDRRARYSMRRSTAPSRRVWHTSSTSRARRVALALLGNVALRTDVRGPVGFIHGLRRWDALAFGSSGWRLTANHRFPRPAGLPHRAEWPRLAGTRSVLDVAISLFSLALQAPGR